MCEVSSGSTDLSGRTLIYSTTTTTVQIIMTLCSSTVVAGE